MPKDLTYTLCPVAHTLCSLSSMQSYYVQGSVTVQETEENLASHIVDPSSVNAVMYHGSDAMFAASPTNSPLMEGSAPTRSSSLFCMWPGIPSRAPSTLVKWVSPQSDGSVADYLTGEYPDDYDWNTAGLAADAKTFEKYGEAEVIHGRWPVSDTLGCFTSELLAEYATVPIAEPLWCQASA